MIGLARSGINRIRELGGFIDGNLVSSSRGLDTYKWSELPLSPRQEVLDCYARFRVLISRLTRSERIALILASSNPSFSLFLHPTRLNKSPPTMPLGHVSLSTGKLHFEQMRDFYTAVLAPLGYAIVMQKEGVFAGFSPKYGAPDFWLHGDGDTSPAFDQAKDKVRERKGKVHVAFDVSSKQVVRNWYENAL